MNIGTVFLVIAVVFFVLMAFEVALGALNLLAVGLAFFAASFLPIRFPRP